MDVEGVRSGGRRSLTTLIPLAVVLLCSTSIVHAASSSTSNSTYLKIDIYGRPHCPDTTAFENDLFEVIDYLNFTNEVQYTLYFVGHPNASLPLGFWMPGGETEVRESLMQVCAQDEPLVTQGTFLMLLRCANIGGSFSSCVRALLPSSLSSNITLCASSPAGRALLRSSMSVSAQHNITYSPTVYFNSALYCLFNSCPCPITDGEDLLHAVCARLPPSPIIHGCLTAPTGFVSLFPPIFNRLNTNASLRSFTPDPINLACMGWPTIVVIVMGVVCIAALAGLLSLFVVKRMANRGGRGASGGRGRERGREVEGEQRSLLPPSFR